MDIDIVIIIQTRWREEPGVNPKKHQIKTILFYREALRMWWRWLTNSFLADLKNTRRPTETIISQQVLDLVAILLIMGTSCPSNGEWKANAMAKFGLQICQFQQQVRIEKRWRNGKLHHPGQVLQHRIVVICTSSGASGDWKMRHLTIKLLSAKERQSKTLNCWDLLLFKNEKRLQQGDAEVRGNMYWKLWNRTFSWLSNRKYAWKGGIAGIAAGKIKDNFIGRQYWLHTSQNQYQYLRRTHRQKASRVFSLYSTTQKNHEDLFEKNSEVTKSAYMPVRWKISAFWKDGSCYIYEELLPDRKIQLCLSENIGRHGTSFEDISLQLAENGTTGAFGNKNPRQPPAFTSVQSRSGYASDRCNGKHVSLIFLFDGEDLTCCCLTKQKIWILSLEI